jgi:hypothetical protein
MFLRLFFIILFAVSCASGPSTWGSYNAEQLGPNLWQISFSSKAETTEEQREQDLLWLASLQAKIAKKRYFEVTERTSTEVKTEDVVKEYKHRFKMIVYEEGQKIPMSAYDVELIDY